MSTPNPGPAVALADDFFDLDTDTHRPPELRTLSMGVAQHGERLDRALAELVTEFSRSYLQQLLEQGAVRLNGKPASKAAQRIKAGDVVVIEMRAT